MRGVIFLLFLCVFSFLYCKYFGNTNTQYAIDIKLDGPFALKDTISDTLIIYKKGIYKLDVSAPVAYLFTISNMGNDTLFVKIDSITGMLLNKYRYYSYATNNMFYLTKEYGIVDNGPVLVDKILPLQTKKYYSNLILSDSGVIELNLSLNSTLISSLNKLDENYIDKIFIKIIHPFFFFDVKNKNLYRRSDELNFHKNKILKQ